MTNSTPLALCPAKTQISLVICPVGSVFTVHMKLAEALSYPFSTQWRLIRLGGCTGWSNCQFRSYEVESVILNHTVHMQALRDSLQVLYAHSFTLNWQLLFLNQRKRKKGVKGFHDQNLLERMYHTPRWGWFCCLLHPKRPCDCWSN